MSFSIVQLVLLIGTATCALALTEQEYYILKYNLHQSIRNTSAFTIEINDAGNYVINISGIPEHDTSDCYNTDMNCCRPNARICRRERSMEIPRNPSASLNETYCTPMGSVGFATSGTPFYNHFEADCVDVNVMPEGTFDNCNGHPSPHGEYHFHRAPNTTCMGVPDNGIAHIIGVAEDGFAVYDSAEYGGVTQSLDECGGFMPDNEPTQYRYVSQHAASGGQDYVIPCFKGIPLKPRCCDCMECGRTEPPGCTRGRGAGKGPEESEGHEDSENRPEFNGGRPPFGQGRPAFGQGRPPFGQGRPPFGQGRPSFGQGRPPFGQGRPTYGQGRPSGGPFGGQGGPGGQCRDEKKGNSQRPTQNGAFNFFSFIGGQQQVGQNPGDCTREQLQQARPQQQEEFDCSTCTDQCVPTGGFKSFAEGRKYTACRRRCQNKDAKSTVKPRTSPRRQFTQQQLNLLQQLLRFLLNQG